MLEELRRKALAWAVEASQCLSSPNSYMQIKELLSVAERQLPRVRLPDKVKLEKQVGKRASCKLKAYR